MVSLPIPSPSIKTRIFPLKSFRFCR